MKVFKAVGSTKRNFSFLFKGERMTTKDGYLQTSNRAFIKAVGKGTSAFAPLTPVEEKAYLAPPAAPKIAAAAKALAAGADPKARAAVTEAQKETPEVVTAGKLTGIANTTKLAALSAESSSK